MSAFYSIIPSRNTRKAQPLGKSGQIMLSIAGFICLIVGIFVINTNYKTVKNGYTITGKIVDLIRSDNAYFPVIEFTPKNSETSIRHKMNTGSSTYANSLGENIELIISQDPQNPKIIIKSFLGIWFLPLILLFIGTIMILVGRIPSQRNETTNTPEDPIENLKKIENLCKQIEATYRSKGLSKEETIRNVNKIKNICQYAPDKDKIRMLEQTLKFIPLVKIKPSQHF